MEVDSIKYIDLIDMGFIRQDIGDDVLFSHTGYYGFCLEMDFPLIDIGIISGCFVSNEKQEWDFKLYRVSTGNTIRPIKIVELKSLIDFFTTKSSEMEEITNQVNDAYCTEESRTFSR